MTYSLLATAFFTSTSNKVALFAGCAALLGIAILSLLVFSQAREIRRLREWAGRAPERAAEMEQKVSEAAAARVVPSTAVAQSVRPVPRTEPIHARPAAAVAATAATRVAGGDQAAPGAVAVPGQPLTARRDAGSAAARPGPAPGSGSRRGSEPAGGSAGHRGRRRAQADSLAAIRCAGPRRTARAGW